MGKQKINQEKGPNLSAVPNKDLMQRMNFLYQVASHLSQQSGPVEESNNRESSLATSKKPRKRKGTLQDLAAFHIRSMKAIGTKSMVKMDPSVKRTICQVCFVVMVPGASSCTRIKPSGTHRFTTIQTCRRCGSTRRLPSPPQPVMDTAKDESIASSNAVQHEATTESNPKRPNRKRVATDLSRRESRSIRPPPLFKRTGHVIQTRNGAIKTEGEPNGNETIGNAPDLFED